MANQLDIFNQQLVQIPTVESANSFTTLDEIFEDFNLIRHQVVNGEHYFVLNDFAEHVVRSSRPSKYVSDLQNELKDKGYDLAKNCLKLPFESNKKFYKTKSVTKETLFKIFQNIRLTNPDRVKQFFKYLGISDEILDRNFQIIRPEIQFGEQVVHNLFKNYKIIPQFTVMQYRIDFYIPELKIAIEFDEHHHKKQLKEDLKRENEIKEILGCIFLRYDLNLHNNN